MQRINESNSIQLPEEWSLSLPRSAAIYGMEDGGVVAGDGMRHRPSLSDGNHVHIVEVPGRRDRFLLLPKALSERRCAQQENRSEAAKQARCSARVHTEYPKVPELSSFEAHCGRGV